MNLAQIRSATRRYLGELGSIYITPTVLDEEINAAMRKLNTDAKFNQVDITLALNPAKAEYTIPSVAMEIYRVRYGSAKTKMDFTSIQELDRVSPGWESAPAGVPTKYYAYGNKIGFYPSPNTTAGATVVYIHCLKDPDTLQTGSDSPSWLPRRYHETIAKGAALSIIGGFDAQAQVINPRIERLYREYVEEVTALITLANHRTEEWRSRVVPVGYANMAKP